MRSATAGCPIDFWFEFASTYSYLSVARIGAIGKAAGVRVRWQPFLLGPIFKSQGWDDSPFNLYPAKGRHMWRDMERLCEGYGLPFRRPTVFPRSGLLAARIACAGRETGEGVDPGGEPRDAPWLQGFVEAVYTANFARDQDISDGALLAGILDALGAPGERIVAQAAGSEAKRRLREQTERAQRSGVFGAPSFCVDGELFWGNDRLADAIAWARPCPSREEPA